MKRTAFYTYITMAALLLSAVGCKKDYQDPSGPSSDQAFSSPQAITDAAVGLQANYVKDRTGLLYTTITSGSLLSRETFVTNPGNADEAQLGTGGNTVLNNNVVVTGMWAYTNKILYDAENVLRATNIVVTDKGYASGLIAYTSIFKALALGVQANFWQQVPDTIGSPNHLTSVGFISGQQGYVRAVNTINNALNAIAANPISPAITPFLPKGINVMNTLYALKARYALYAGDYASALDAAGKVDLTSTSSFIFNPQVANPIFTLVSSTSNIYQVVDNKMGLPAGLQPDASDARVPFYMTAQPAGLKFVMAGFFKTNIQSIPVFLPGEIMLIKAECYARTNNLPLGLAELNKVVTKKPADDPFGIGANLPPVAVATIPDLLTQIYKHRRIEMFMSGQEIEDERRFGRPTAERTRSYFPYPFVERNDNPNTPPDPTF
ncbi:RagB/SusD family nutrient uptake outer membrane protein [Chitinophaga qingshengii]|uniref:RagB/SusD family nutrient uptake outer membrane protein n=1 Tax=Chitinophaga qingshengii TaxID=1569794 RepID=A0ABR7TN33_9BACT|nr:RagB/SusD family nutrient uptake outer membrane protein [Chitinophaga qingshengii]MBC9930927.1 RagB/SusD family nutrient uptake outer membrane protein [Chitinophaga qingshengii]